MLRRLCRFGSAYGLGPDEHASLIDAIIEGKRVGSAFVQSRVARGESTFIEMWKRRGGGAGDRRRLRWLENNRAKLLAGLANGEALSVQRRQVTDLSVPWHRAA